MLKKSVFLMFLLLCCSSVFFASKHPVVVYCDAGYYPFSYEEDGQAKGLYVDVLEEAFSRMENFEVVLEPIPWKRGKVYMENGTGFALTPVFYHAHDWGYIYPYSLPFNVETIITVFLKDNDGEAKSNVPEDYIGLKVGNMAGFDGWVPPEMKKMIDDGKIGYEEARNSEIHIQKLVAGRVDCIIVEKLSFEFQLRQLKQEGKIPEDIDFSYAAIIGEDPVYVGYSEANDAEYQLEFQKELDNVLYQMIKANEIEAIFANFEE